MTRLFDRMRKIDPAYGKQDHQTLFMHRMIELDRRYPCKRDHTSADPCSKDHAMNDVRRHPEGEHSACCYTTDQLKEVYAWQKQLLAKQNRPPEKK